MRLLNTKTLRLETFDGQKLPPYAILSHTWENEEVLFQDIESTSGGNNTVTKVWNSLSNAYWRMFQNRRSWNKIFNACWKARQNRPPFDYIWIDTCCIDKTSSVELSEAINSMFQMYQNAAVCYAYLADVEETTEGTASLEISLRKARWFTRGWTLQELIAPITVILCGTNWETIGTKVSRRTVISSITGISVEVLLNPRLLSSMSVAHRMSWAANRKTTRTEDIAYCLMGIFDVNMPLLYGEGNKAFIRLQEEIIRDSEDQSLFAWQYPRVSLDMEGQRELLNEGILAHHPIAFKESSDIVPHWTNHAPYMITSRGLEIEIPVAEGIRSHEDNTSSFVGILSCFYNNNLSGTIAIPLKKASEKYYRDQSSALVFLEHEKAATAKVKTVHIHKWGISSSQTSRPSYCYLRRLPSEVYFSSGIMVAAASPEATAMSGSSSDESESVWVLNKENTSWNHVGKTAVLVPSSEGHFAGLEFTNSRNFSAHSGLPDGFTIVLKLFPGSFGVVAVVPWTQSEQKGFGFLRQILEENSNSGISASSHFLVGKGDFRVVLESGKLFDQHTYVVDIDYYSAFRSGPVDTAVHQFTDIRLIESDD